MINNAKWITSPIDTGAATSTFKKAFAASGEVNKATLYATAMGIYVPYINGKRVGKNVLAPGWTGYKNRIQYQSYDVTALIKNENMIEIGLGQGWAVGCIGFDVCNHYFADHTSVIALLDISYKDGSNEKIITDTTWEVYTGEVTFSEIYHGETVDKAADIKLIGDAVLSDVRTLLIPQIGEDIIEAERFSPVEVIHTPKGETVLDFGQNMTGYLEINIKGEKGSRIVFKHGEILDKDGNFYNDNYRTAKSTNTYILSGGQDLFKTLYSYQGFRYIKLCEYPFDHVDPKLFTAVVVHSDIKRTGSFRCGNEKINQLYHNIIWGQKSNYLDVPTDCPQRDERLGWTGDAQVFARTAAINFDVEKFFRKWLGDVVLEQGSDGAVYGVVPNCLEKVTSRISAAWGDSVCIIPWELYLAYGNIDILKENFSAMKKWVDYVHSQGPEEYLWLGGLHYGDWLALDAGEDSLVGATSNDLIASAFFAYSTSILISAGKVLGEPMEDYCILYNNIVKAFRDYFMEDGMPKEDFPYTEEPGDSSPVDTKRLGVTQTALTLILHFNLCTDKQRQRIAAKLAQLIEENGDRMTTGFVGTPYIMHALSENGYTSVAYKLLMQEKSPSWLYSVCNGATTMWEHWNGIKEDGTLWNKNMNSFNHYAYGAVFDWIFGVALGIKPVAEAPGYKKITISPKPDKCLGFAEAAIESRHGRISSKWYYNDNETYFEFEIPKGVTAHITLPSGYNRIVGEGTYKFSE